MDTIDISNHRPALGQLAKQHHLPLAEVIDRILVNGIAHEDEIFDWSPSPAAIEEPATVALFEPVPELEPMEARELQSA